MLKQIILTSKKNILLSLLLFALHTQNFAQYDFKDAYYVSNSGDTIYGQIDYNKPSINSKHFFFRTDSLGTVKKYLPQDVQAYSYVNSKVYFSKTITLLDSSRTLFLEYLVNGVVDLYYINYGGFDYFLIFKDGVMNELSNKIVYRNNGSTKKNSQQYIGVLQYLMQDAPSLHDKINQTKFTSMSLIELVQEYHKQTCNENQICQTYYRKEEKLNDAKWNFSFGVTLEYTFSNQQIVTETPRNGTTFYGNPLFFINENYGSVRNRLNPISPGIALNISRNTRYSVQLGVIYVQSSSTNLDVSNLIFPINWQVNLTRYTKFTPYIELGLTGDVLLKSEFKDLYIVSQKLGKDGENPVYEPQKTAYIKDSTIDKRFKIGYNISTGIKLTVLKTHEARLTFGLRGSSHSFHSGNDPDLITWTTIKTNSLIIGVGFFL